MRHAGTQIQILQIYSSRFSREKMLLINYRYVSGHGCYLCVLLSHVVESVRYFYVSVSNVTNIATGYQTDEDQEKVADSFQLPGKYHKFHA